MVFSIVIYSISFDHMVPLTTTFPMTLFYTFVCVPIVMCQSLVPLTMAKRWILTKSPHWWNKSVQFNIANPGALAKIHLIAWLCVCKFVYIHLMWKLVYIDLINTHQKELVFDSFSVILIYKRLVNCINILILIF